MTVRTLDDLKAEAGSLSGKRVLVRVDLNVPMANGQVSDASRIERSAGTLKELAEAGAKVILLSHFGRPKGKPNPDLSLKPVVPAIEKATGLSVSFAPDCVGPEAAQAVQALAQGSVLVLENTRFHEGEEKNDPEFAIALAADGDFYVNDAFSAAHRAHASTEGITKVRPSFAGRAMQSEIEALQAVLEKPERPVAAVVGGAKVSTKLELLENLVGRMDYLIIGGGMANTFLAAMHKPVGKSLCEHDLTSTAQAILDKAKATNCDVVIPRDGVVAKEFKAMADHRTAAADDVAEDEMILDVGPETLKDIAARFEAAKTIVWNGPLGAFETPPFDQGTMEAARMVAMLTKQGAMTSVAGGGDTLAALNEAGAADDFSYVSTAGGAFLEWLEGKSLPGVEALRK